MHQYKVKVNGNTYTVTVKSIIGTSAMVDVDGLEFQVEIGEGGVESVQHIAAASVAPAEVKAPPKPSAVTPPVAPKPSAPVEKGQKPRVSVLDKPVAKPSEQAQQVTGKGVVAAHLPGQIVEINVKVGDKVKKGDLVCKMEAMKMVNEVKSTVDGVVKQILVNLQQNVLENQALMVIE